MQAQRLFDTLEELSTCNATPGNGVTRFSWSEADSRARRVLERELKAIGLEPWTDGMGNLHARIEGSTGAPAVLTGSHLDTVRNGGRYDGTYGVVAALEALRSFHDEGYKPRGQAASQPARPFHTICRPRGDALYAPYAHGSDECGP